MMRRELLLIDDDLKKNLLRNIKTKSDHRQTLMSLPQSNAIRQ